MTEQTIKHTGKLLCCLIAALLLCGCGIFPDRICETAHFRLSLPHGLSQAEGAEEGWDAALNDRKGYTFQLQDADTGGMPDAYMNRSEDTEHSWEAGFAGELQYCGYIEAGADGTRLIDYAAGCEGRVLHIRATVPEKQQKRAYGQLMQLLTDAVYTGPPLGAGTVEDEYFTLTYTANWTPVTSPDEPHAVRFFESRADTETIGAAALTVTATADMPDDPETRANKLAEQTKDTKFAKKYRSISTAQRRRLGFVTWAALLVYDGGDEDADPIITEHCFFEANGISYELTFLYSESGQDEYFKRVLGIGMTLPEAAEDGETTQTETTELTENTEQTEQTTARQTEKTERTEQTEQTGQPLP